MGMFDEILVKQDLPLPEEIKDKFDWKNHSFQTKDLDNYLGHYIINEYRDLVEVIVERDYIPYTEEEKKSLKLNPWNLWKEVKEGPTSYKNTNYHGAITFYAYENFDEETDFWVDFKAYFVYGKLDKIELVEYNKQKSQKYSHKEFQEKYEKQQKEPWNLFKKYASYLGWRWFWRNASNVLYQVSQSLSAVSMSIRRNLV